MYPINIPLLRNFINTYYEPLKGKHTPVAKLCADYLFYLKLDLRGNDKTPTNFFNLFKENGPLASEYELELISKVVRIKDLSRNSLEIIRSTEIHADNSRKKKSRTVENKQAAGNINTTEVNIYTSDNEPRMEDHFLRELVTKLSDKCDKLEQTISHMTKVSLDNKERDKEILELKFELKRLNNNIVIAGDHNKNIYKANLSFFSELTKLNNFRDFIKENEMLNKSLLDLIDVVEKSYLTGFDSNHYKRKLVGCSTYNVPSYIFDQVAYKFDVEDVLEIIKKHLLSEGLLEDIPIRSQLLFNRHSRDLTTELMEFHETFKKTAGFDSINCRSVIKDCNEIREAVTKVGNSIVGTL